MNGNPPPDDRLAGTTHRRPPLRTEQARLEFCDEYFASVGAKTIHRAEGYREYQIPRDVDKELTDRPYYWMWVEQTGQPVPESILRLAFHEQALTQANERLREQALREARERQLSDWEIKFLRVPQAELVSLGSFRLAKICDSVELRGRFASAVLSGVNQCSGIPWLLMHVLVSRQSDLVEQTLVNAAICLENGQIVDDFFTKISPLPFVPADAASLLSGAKVSLQDAFALLIARVEQWVAKEPNEWAFQARERLASDLCMLNTYYDSIAISIDDPTKRTHLDQERERKIQEARTKAEPRIDLAVKQVALIGLPER